MILHEVEQGSDEWFLMRGSIPTASSFDKIITTTGAASQQAKTYMNKLLANWLCPNVANDEFYGEWMARGHELEDEARLCYEFQRDSEVFLAGFCTTDDGSVGCSPDGLIGNEGGLEIKCPSPGAHTGYLIDDHLPTKYFCQVQGNLFVTGRKWWDFISYHPEIDPFIVRVYPEPDFQASLKTRLDKFVNAMQAKQQILRERGVKRE